MTPTAADAGVMHVNDQTVADEPQLPLGGVKGSGWGLAHLGDWPIQGTCPIEARRWLAVARGRGSPPAARP